MTVAVSTLLGRPLWYELMTTDMKAAEAFYRNVVGWTSAPFEGSPQPYTMFNRSGDVPVAGLMTRPDGMNAPPFWAMYIGVPKLEEAVTHIKRLGGERNYWGSRFQRSNSLPQSGDGGAHPFRV